jgi:hypothetical protein
MMEALDARRLLAVSVNPNFVRIHDTAASDQISLAPRHH